MLRGWKGRNVIGMAEKRKTHKLSKVSYTSLLMVGVQTCTATTAVPQNVGTQSTSRSSYTTLGHIPKGFVTLPQGHLLNHTSAIFILARTGNNLHVPQQKNRLKKWDTFIKRNISHLLKNDIMKFSGKWMDHKSSWVRELKPGKITVVCFTYMWMLAIKEMISKL